MRVMVLYRPWLPALRAQSLQVVYSAHALARRGHQVVVCYRPTPGDPLAPFGLAHEPGLQLWPLPRGGTAASLAMRYRMLRFDGVFLAREKRLARDLLRLRPRARVVLEAHEVDSLQRPCDATQALEREVFAGVSAVIANCEGVASQLRAIHGVQATVVHNGGVVVEPAEPGNGWVVPGSLGPGKDLETVALAAREVGGIDLIGPTEPGRWIELQRLARGALRWRGEVAPAAVPQVLQRYRAGIVPLGTGWFGRELTSPLKAWSLLGARVPFAGADLPSLQRVAPDAFEPYTPGDPASLVAALRRLGKPTARARCLDNARPRSWDQRAAEVEAVLA